MTKTWTPDGDISPLQLEGVVGMPTLAMDLRVPLLTSLHPSWPYLTGIVVGRTHFYQPGGKPFEAMLPTEDEVRHVAAWLDSYKLFYRKSYLNHMAEFAPFDIDGAANLGYLLKHSDGCWHYRKRTWESPPLFPLPLAEHEPISLELITEKSFGGWS
jgi:hypothetical protein